MRVKEPEHEPSFKLDELDDEEEEDDLAGKLAARRA